MVKKLTNRLLGIFSVMMLMLMTALSANAAYYLKGTFNGWGDGNPMTQRADGLWTVNRTFEVGDQFQIVSPNNEYYGLPASGTYWLEADDIGTGEPYTLVYNTQSMEIRVAGEYTILFDETNLKMLIGEKAPVTVKNNDTHGSVSVNPTEAIPGETITITANPANGYYTDVDHITVEKTINGGSAQAPGLKDGPGVGQYVENIQAGEEANTFTFAMPEAPYGAQVSAEFLENIVHSVIIDVDPQTAHGSVTSNKSTAEEGEEIILTITPETGYELDVLTVGGATVTVTGNTYTFTMGDADVHVNATFKKINYDITITVNHSDCGNVTGPATATFNEDVTLNISVNEDCALVELKVDGQVVEVSGNTYTFKMPSHAVAVEATFRALEVSYEMRWGTGDPWSDQHAVVLAKDETTGKLVANNNIIPAQYEAVLVKIVDGQEILMGADTQGQGDYWITVGYIANPVDISMGVMDNYHRNLYFPSAGEYNFSYDPSEKKLKVTGEFIYNVTITEPQHGSVTANPTSGKKDTEITLTITPDTGYEVGNISVTYGNNQTVDVTDNDDGTYTFQMPAGDVTVTVTFNPKAYDLTVTSNEYGSVTVEGKTLDENNKVSVNYTENVQLNIAANEDCVLDKLEVDGVDMTSQVANNTYTFTMPNKNVTVNATFRKLDVSYWVVWGVTPEGANSWESEHWLEMTLSGENYVLADQDMEKGREFKIVKLVQDGDDDPNPEDTWYGAEADYLYWINAQTLGTSIILGVDINTYKNLYFASDGTYTFTFTPSTKTLVVTGAFDYNITVNNTTPDYGSVTAPPKAKANATVNLTVTPEEGYRIDELYYMEGETRVNIDGTSFTMPAHDVTINASFTRILAKNELTWNVAYATLEVKVGEDDAAVAIESGAQVQEGDKVNVTISQTPEQVAEWTISKVTIVYSTTTTELTATEGVYTFEMPAAATEIKVEFTAVQHNITVADNEYVTVDAPATAAAGQEVTITVTPNDDFVVTGVTVNDGDVVVTDNEDGTYTFTMPEGADGVEVDITVAAKIQGVSFTAERNWATYIGAYDLAKPAGVEAIYVVTGVQGDAVVIESVDYIPANKGVLLYSEDAGENFVAELYAGDLDATISTKLVGSATASTTSTIEDYVLYDNNFIRSQGGSVAAHRCYLPGTEVQGAPRMLKIGYDGDVPTAIETLIAEGNVANVKYVNMSGMTSDKPFNGINIAVVTFTDGTTKAIKLVK